MKTVLETITPAVAEKYIDTMDGNRAVRQTRVDYLVDQMRTGLWRVTHQGIAFDTKGRLIDGQHRMWAVIFAKVEVQMNVTRGVDPNDVSVIDTGISRTFSDFANFEGVDQDPIAATVAKILVLGPGNYRRLVPFDMILKWRSHYQEQIDLAIKVRTMSRRGKGKMIPIGITAAFARAAFVIKPTILERMATILGDGIVDDQKETAAIALRDAWIGERIGRMTTEQYFKTEAAIRAFADRRALKNLQRPESEIYDIPALPKALRYEPKASNHRKTVKLLKAQAGIRQTT